MHDSLQAVNPRQNRIFNNKADGFFHHFVGVAESIRNFFQIFGLVKFFCQRIVNAGQFGQGVYHLGSKGRQFEVLAAAPETFDVTALDLGKAGGAGLAYLLAAGKLYWFQFNFVFSDFLKNLVPQPHKKLEEQIGLVFGFEPGRLACGPKRRNDVGGAQVKVGAANGAGKLHFDHGQRRRAAVMPEKFFETFITNIFVLTFPFILLRIYVDTIRIK